MFNSPCIAAFAQKYRLGSSSKDPWLASWALGLLALILAASTCGCASDRPIRITIADKVQRPERSVVVFFVDGLGRDIFDAAMAEERLPNIATHLVNRGIVVDHAVTCIPSITYAASVTFLTGRQPGHHGVLSNRWMEPSTGRFQNYCHIKTYQQVDGDYPESPTLYELLDDRVTVSIQAAMRRGCTRSWDNWASSGLNWFFDNPTGVDCLVAQRFEEIGERAVDWGQWPDLIWAYFPAMDNIGHRFRPDSDKHRAALRNVDHQIGHICDALIDMGVYDNTTLCLISDHGMAAVEPEQVFDIGEHLRSYTGARVWQNDYTSQQDESRLLQTYDFAVATTASRWTAVYPISESQHSAKTDIEAFAVALDNLENVGNGPIDGKPLHPMEGNLMPTWLKATVNHAAVEMMACSFTPGRVHLFTRSGHAVIIRSQDGIERHSVLQAPGNPVFSPDSLLPPSSPPPHQATTDSRLWLAVSASSRYPDLVPAITAMFDHERSGSIVFFASTGWDFSSDDPAGGHGSILPEDMLVPMVFAGAGINRAGSIPFARACDVMPTLLHILGTRPERPDGTPVDIDGVNLLSDTGITDH